MNNLSKPSSSAISPSLLEPLFLCKGNLIHGHTVAGLSRGPSLSGHVRLCVYVGHRFFHVLLCLQSATGLAAYATLA